MSKFFNFLIVLILFLFGMALFSSRAKSYTKVAVLGDSLSSQGIWIKALNNACGSNYTFDNYSYDGAGVLDVSLRIVCENHSSLSNKMINFKDYDEVIIWLGINDISLGAEVVQSIFGLAQAAVSAGVKKVYILTLPPCETYANKTGNVDWPVRIRVINRFMLGVLTEDNIKVIDIWELFLDQDISEHQGTIERMNPEFTTDGLHLNKHGNIGLGMFLFNEIYREASDDKALLGSNCP